MSGAKKIIFFILVLASISIWAAVLSFPDERIHIVGCNVGQGDAFLIYKGNTQVLIDGGPSNKVLECLSKYVPFWDRSIEMIILTHPQQDHFGGITNVIERYNISYFVDSGEKSDLPTYQKLVDTLNKKRVNHKNISRGVSINVNDIVIHTIWPPEENTRSYNSEEEKDPNYYSLVFSLTYKNFDALFTGDIVPSPEKEMLLAVPQVEYLKVPHHGSRNGLTQEFLSKANPQVAVISSGNKYGHPHKEVLDMLNNFEVKVLRTDQKQDVQIVTDGDKWWHAQ